MMLGFCSGPAEGGQAVEEWTKPWDRAQMCFEVVRQAEMWVGTGKAGCCWRRDGCGALQSI